MTDYRELFECAFNEAFRKAPFSDDETFVNIVKERTINMEKKKTRSKKPAVIAASIAAAAALTVTAGAALNWDIASLFQSANVSEREEHSSISGKTLREYFDSENFTVRGTSAETEYDILQGLSHEVDRDFEVDGLGVHFTGYAYDGCWLELLYEVTFTNNIPDGEYPFPIAVVSASDDIGFTDAGFLTKITNISENTVKYRSYHDVDIPGELGLRLFFIEDEERLAAHIKGMSYETENFVDIRLNGENEYSYSKDVDITLNNEYTYSDEGINNNVRTKSGYVHISNIRISPFGIIISGTSDDGQNSGQGLPIIAVFNDGTVTDISHRMGGGNANDDGSFDFVTSFSSNGVLLDAREMTELRIGDAVIPINA